MDAPEASLTLNCGYGRGFTVIEVLDAAEGVTGASVNRRLEARRPGDPAVLVADVSKIGDLGWTPAHADLAEIITHALAWERTLGSICRGLLSRFLRRRSRKSDVWGKSVSRRG